MASNDYPDHHEDHQDANQEAHPSIKYVRAVLDSYLTNPDMLTLARCFLDSEKADLFGWQIGFPRDYSVCSIPVFRDKKLDVTIFFLEPGSRLNLHGHPNAVGAIKVASGTVIIKPLTFLKPEENDLVRKYKSINTKSLLCEKLLEFTLSETDDPWAFDTEIGNAHEVICGPVFSAVVEAHMTLKEDLSPMSDVTKGWRFLNQVPVQVGCVQLASKFITILHDVVTKQDIRVIEMIPDEAENL